LISLGNKLFDAYIVCSKGEKDQEFFSKYLMRQLNTYYTLCIPDRDFLIGSGKFSILYATRIFQVQLIVDISLECINMQKFQIL